MKPITIKLITAFLLFGAQSALAQGGSMGGGGGDLRTLDPGDAWFVGPDRTIFACVTVNPNFVKTKEEIQIQIEAVFLKWNQYIQSKVTVLRSSDRIPATRIAFTENCTTADLRFLMGVETSEVTEAKKQYQDPIAFVHRTSGPRQHPWGKGFVWFKSEKFWGYSDTLYGMLLHETGHILGNDHASGTIMDADYAKRVASASPQPEQSERNRIATHTELTEIDQRAELVSGSRKFTGIISVFTHGIPDYDGLNPNDPRHFVTGDTTFKRLMGRERKGDIYTTLELPPISPASWENSPALRFTVRDDLGSQPFFISLVSRSTFDFENAFGTSAPKAFFTVTDGNLLDSYNRAAAPASYLGKMNTPAGEWVVQVELNTAQPSPIRIMYLDGMVSRELMITRFVTDTSQTWKPYRHRNKTN